VKSGQVVTLPSTKQWFLKNIWCWCISGDHPKNGFNIAGDKDWENCQNHKKNWQANLPELAP
jgi:hypothetical protein